MHLKPIVSLIICTYNRDKYLPQALDSIAEQDFDKSLFELIVVDNSSTDNTVTIVKLFISSHPELNANYCFEEKKGLGFARNRGLHEAAGNLLCYVDDDAILSKGYLRQVVSFFNSCPAAIGAGGKVIPKYDSGTEPEWMSKYMEHFAGRLDYGKEIKQFNDSMKYPAGCNMIYKKEVLLTVGGFNNDLTFRSDDKDIFLKVKKNFSQIYYLPEAYVYHFVDSHRLSFDNFRKLFLKTGNEEKKRIGREKGMQGLLRKLIELTIKLGGSMVLYLLFFLKGKEIKGRYIFLAQWYTWKGFLLRDVFVR